MVGDLGEGKHDDLWQGKKLMFTALPIFLHQHSNIGETGAGMVDGSGQKHYPAGN